MRQNEIDFNFFILQVFFLQQQLLLDIFYVRAPHYFFWLDSKGLTLHFLREGRYFPTTLQYGVLILMQSCFFAL